MDNFFDNRRILSSIWKWKTHLIVIITLTVVLSAIISGPWFITPKFESSARVYPVNITEASEESESEHLLEYLRSNDIRFRMIDAFKLDEVYDISRDEKLYQTWILYEYEQNVSYKKTEFESIEIQVLDEDPVRARDMVDSLIVFLNDKLLSERNKKHLEFAKVYKKALDQKQHELDSLGAVVDQIRAETGLIDYFSEATTATEGLLQAAARGGDRKPALQAVDNLVKWGGVLRVNQELIKDYEVAADTLRLRYERAMSNGTKVISHTRIVEHPFVADKKAYPIRWLIVFLSTAAAGFVSLITVLLIDYFRESKPTL
ncbi:GumC domain-containing protein [Roseimarinus sediminis]|uniref:hypothetical protein n=1 Tax=Roseimarinus sediminis TaxID=1610899 RepID=UPI003D19AA4E